MNQIFKMFAFNRCYFLFTILLFATEVIIACYVHDDFIRPYFGDFLVVVLIYCFVKSFVNVSVLKAAVFVLLFSFGIETLQYLNIIEILGWEKSRLARTVIGHSFSWIDIYCYIAGILCVLAVEYLVMKKRSSVSA